MESRLETRSSIPSRQDVLGTVGDDLLFADGELIVGPQSTAERIKRTMADIRTVATASEAFAVDWGHYPELPRGVVPSSSLTGSLSPIYVKRMPKRDGWGNAFALKYEARGYLIVSYGADGLPQFKYGDWTFESSSSTPNTYSDPADDIVYSNGTFVSYPVEMFRR